MQSWVQLFRQDFGRYKQYRPHHSAAVIFFTEQGLWALLQHRVASAIYASDWPRIVKAPALAAMVVWQKIVEILTGVSLPYCVSLGPGLYIGHYGTIIIHPDAVVGANCNILQGVTIGISGRGSRRGVPRIGDRVHICANAVLAGKIVIGDDVTVGACSLVVTDAPSSSTLVGVPAKIVNYSGSAAYIGPVSVDEAA